MAARTHPTRPAGRPRNLREELGKRDAFELPEQEAYLNLVRTHAQLSREFAQLFKDHGLSDPQYNALRIIGAAGSSGIHSETVGESMVARDPDTTRLIDRLEAAGLVERSRSPDDRRCVVVSITPAGSALLRKLARRVTTLHRKQLGHLTGAQLKRLNELLFAVRMRQCGLSE